MSNASKALGRVLAVAGLAGLAAACSVPTTYKVDQQNWDPSKLSYAAGQGALLTEVRGNPFNTPKAQVDKAITDTMYAAHFGPTVPFVTEKPQDYKSPYRVVILFNPDTTLDSDKLCNEDPQPGAKAQGEIRIAAALCAQDVHETSVWGSVGQTSGPESAEFQALIRSMTAQLFPRENPNLRDNNNKIWIIGG